MSDPLELPLSAITEKPNADLVTSLIFEIWGISTLNSRKIVDLYLDHYTGCVRTLDHALLRPKSHRDVVDTVTFLKKHRHETLQSLKANALAVMPPLRILKEQSEPAAEAAIFLGMRVWLMTGSRDWNENTKLSDHIKQQFSAQITRSSGSLSLTARSIYQVGGVEILWTNRLEDHLRFDNLSPQLFLFNNASFLRDISLTASDMFPPHFLTETSMTLALLFPLSDSPKKRWNKRARKRADVDIEEGLACAPRDLTAYRHWGEQLARLQGALDSSKPRMLRQLLHDRRDGAQQATFWLAVAAVVLSLLFGLVQSVAGVLQVLK